LLSELPSAAPLPEEMWCLTHTLHPARYDASVISGTNSHIGKHDRVQSRAADFVYRDGSDSGRECRVKSGLPGRSLTNARRNNLPHNDLIDRFGRYARALDGPADGVTAQFNRS
jgi:hypothetical protein